MATVGIKGLTKAHLHTHGGTELHSYIRGIPC